MKLEPNVCFQQKTEEEFPKPFYNMRAKIRGGILFKRRGMMRSEFLCKVWSYGKSWGVTEERVISERLRNSQPVGFGRPNSQFSVDGFVQ